MAGHTYTDRLLTAPAKLPRCLHNLPLLLTYTYYPLLAAAADCALDSHEAPEEGKCRHRHAVRSPSPPVTELTRIQL